jgi:hypothetical protein
MLSDDIKAVDYCVYEEDPALNAVDAWERIKKLLEEFHRQHITEQGNESADT